MMDAVIKEWLGQVVSAESARDGITSADIRRLLACFYANNGLVLSRDPEMLQQAFDILTGIFLLCWPLDQHQEDRGDDNAAR